MITILIVDDDRVNRMLLSHVLLRNGYSYIEEDNGATAVSIVEQRSISAVIMDVGMPIMDGHEATRRIRDIATSTGRCVPIIGLSGFFSAENRHKGLTSGMVDYMENP